MDNHKYYKPNGMEFGLLPKEERSPCAVVEAVRQDLLDRSKKGVSKYGTTLSENPAPQKERLQHLYEELLDAANYLKWELIKKEEQEETEIIKKLKSEVKHWKANHAQIVERLRLFTQREDLPVDRLPAYRTLIALQESNLFLLHYMKGLQEIIDKNKWK